MPCSMTCSAMLRSRRLARGVTRCSTERESRSSRMTFSLSPLSSWSTRSSFGRDAFAPLVVSTWMLSRSMPARNRASIWSSGFWSAVETHAQPTSMWRNLPAAPFADVDFRREFPTLPTCGFVITGVGVLGRETPAAARLENIARFSDFISESILRAAEQVREVLYTKPETAPGDTTTPGSARR